MLGVLTFAAACGVARAGVYLSSRAFTTNNLPYIWTDEAMPATYKLRAKITGVPGYDGGFHAATTYNNNWMPLDTCPPPGSYLLTLYWIKWDANGNSTVGPMANFNIQVLTPDTNLPTLSTTAFEYIGQKTQLYTVPTGANCVQITAWGGAGGGSVVDQYGNRHSGGSGGAVTAVCNVTPGEIFTITVASGGGAGAVWPNVNQPGWPGGGTATPTCNPGGGFTRVQTAYGDVWAGGGGAESGYGDGGDGGQPDGNYGSGPDHGGGGTSTAGGWADPEYAKPGVAGAGGYGEWAGGGGGYFGGGGGGTSTSTGAAVNGGGGGGSSIILGEAYGARYTTAINADQNGHGGGNGGVVIRAFNMPSPSLPITVVSQSFWDPMYTYYPPSSAAFVVVKAWAAGGTSGGPSSGGAGAYVIAVYPGAAPLDGRIGCKGLYQTDAGYCTYVRWHDGTHAVYAGAGGGGGNAPTGNGGAGGAPNGQNGADGYGSGTGGQGATVTAGPVGTGGSGGNGNGYSNVYDDSGNIIDTVGVGAGGNGANADISNNPASCGGDGGSPGDIPGDQYGGGKGGWGFGGGGGGGGGDNSQGGGGGGGGGTAVVAGAGMQIGMFAGSGANPPGTNDPDYPGQSVAAGGVNGSYGGPGAVVFIAYPAGGSAPASAVSATQSAGLNHVSDFPMTFSNSPLFYSAAGLPPGLTIDGISGHVVGTPTTMGTFTSTVTATNPYGATPTTMTWTITAADTSPPTMPTALQANETSLTALTLSWAAASDNVSVYGYEVQQDGVSLGTTSVSSFSVSNLAAESTHTFAVRARDPAGNWSAWSTPVTITMTDHVPPTAPTSLNYADETATTVTLTWRASSDNVGVTGYAVYRGGQQIGTTADLVFVDSGLTANTAYTYTVKAFDAAGNFSTGSAALTVTTTQDFSADSDHDGIPDATESALGTNSSVPANADTTNQTQQNIHRPTQ